MSAVFPIAAPQAAVRAVWVREPCDLEARLVAEARAPAALRRALTRVAAAIVAVRGWERLGHARAGDYAVEFLGISGRELRDLATVGRALGELPMLDAAFQAGEIGWTQLRLLCRVATAEDEEHWLALAKSLTARALSREVHAVDRRAREPIVFEGEDDDRRVAVVLRLTPRTRARWWSTRQVASRVAGRALSHGAFAEVLAAEVLSAVPVEIEDAEKTAPGRAGEAAGRSCLLRLPPLPPPPFCAGIDALERDLDTADAFELDRRLRRAVRMEARHLARMAALLEDVVVRGLHRNLGFRSVDAYAEDRLGMAASRARALLRIERAARGCPPLRKAFANGHLSWIQAYVLVPLLLEPAAARYRDEWVTHARRITVRRLGSDVERALALGEWAPPPLEASVSGDANPAGLQTGAHARLEKESERLVFTAVPEAAQLFRAVLATVQRRLEQIHGRPCRPGDALEAMLDHALATWCLNQRTRRSYRAFERDGWRCTAPGCTSYRNLHRHHIVFRSKRGSNVFSYLTALCAWHHERGVHGHVLRCTGTAPDELRFELGLRSDGPPLAVYRSGEVLMK
jgi:hypothetical protein